MPFHYALSELLIVFASLWCILTLGRDGRGFAAAGTALFGLAAVIGILRISLGGFDPLPVIHRTVSQYGGLLGMAFIALAFARPYWQQTGKVVGLSLAAASLVAAIVKPEWTTPLFLIWAVSAVIEAFFYAGKNIGKQVFAALLMSLVLVNLVFVRQSPALGPDISWHAFHVLIALWLLCVCFVVMRPGYTS